MCANDEARRLERQCLIKLRNRIANVETDEEFKQTIKDVPRLLWFHSESAMEFNILLKRAKNTNCGEELQGIRKEIKKCLVSILTE